MVSGFDPSAIHDLAQTPDPARRHFTVFRICLVWLARVLLDRGNPPGLLPHMQCFVNSLLHLKPGLPEGVDSSQNIWWLGPLQVTAWGENWHGNHHSKPASACFSRHWWQVDIGWYVIRSLEAVGLATNVRR
jgi:hypothetical protein